MNTDRSGRGSPRHHQASDPLVLEASAADGMEGVTNNWTVYRVANGGWLRFDKVVLGAGYQRVRVVYGTTGSAPRSIEVRLDGPDGLLVGTVSLTATDIPRAGSIQIFREATGDLTASAGGTRDIYLRFVSADGSPVAEVEYVRFERYRCEIPLAKNDVRLELRAGARDGELLGVLFPRATGGADRFCEFVGRLEAASGVQPLFVVVRSALDGPLGTIQSVRLERAASPIDETGVGVPPREGPHGPIFPAATNRPCDRPADRYATEPDFNDRPFTVATRFRPAASGGPAVAVDGVLSEWQTRGITLARSLEGAAMADNTGTCWFGRDDKALYVAARLPTCPANARPPGTPTTAHRWPDGDGFEIAVQDRFATPAGPIMTLRGWPDGYFECPDVAGLPPDKAAAVASQITYKTAQADSGQGWTCEWRIPFSTLGIAADRTPRLAANATLRAASCDAWRSWRMAGTATGEGIPGRRGRSRCRHRQDQPGGCRYEDQSW
ncbi:MAG: carbohydrate-binding protein, partial [Planctomycetota bacterium]